MLHFICKSNIFHYLHNFDMVGILAINETVGFLKHNIFKTVNSHVSNQ